MKLDPIEGVYTQWAEKGSYRLEQLKQTIKNLPNRHNIFTAKNYCIYVLDDYAVHLMPEVRKAFFDRGYILVIIGGGITGHIQVLNYKSYSFCTKTWTKNYGCVC